MKKLLSALFLLALCSSLAMATVPDPSKCSVTPDYNGGCLIAPGVIGGTTLSITVRNSSNNPINNAVVTVSLNAAIAICTTAQHSANTNVAGQCSITLKGGGCVNAQTPGAASVVANGIEIKNYDRVKSPDNSHHTASIPSGAVTVADLPYFADEFKGAQPAGCHDYTNDGACTVADLPTFGDAFKLGLSCTI